MINLSVNVNKVATLRNSRGGAVPRVLDAVQVCIDAGVAGITVHPRSDQRHITPQDVRDVAALLRRYPAVEYNIEGDPRPDLLALVADVRPHQCTLVPVVPGEVTSQAGWMPGSQTEGLADTVADLRAKEIRVSLFVDAESEAIRFAASIKADRVELYTEPFARAYERGAADTSASFDRYARAAMLAASFGLGINAGHDLDLDNLQPFRELPHLAEVSIGHALMSRALFVGLPTVVREYLAVLSPGGGTGRGAVLRRF
jgi:pyridoxine 5-phosphate synthase